MPKVQKKSAVRPAKARKGRLAALNTLIRRHMMLSFVLVFALTGTVILILVFAGSLNETDEIDLYNRVNNYRQQQGTAALGRSGCITYAAREWAQHMAVYGQLHHSDGTNGAGTMIHAGDPGAVALIEKYCPKNEWGQIAENVGVGATSDGLFNAFVASPEHLKNLSNPVYTWTGAGAYRDDSGRLWVAQLFVKCYTTCSSGWTTAPSSPAQTATYSANAAISVAMKRDGSGYWTTTSAGKITPYNSAPFYGDMSGKVLNQPIVGIAVKPDSSGYWLVARDGGLFAFGGAGFYGSMGGQTLNQPIVGMAVTPSGNGYWMVAADGGMFAFGDAGFYGSMGGQALNKPIVGMASTPTGQGYWLVASDGGIFAFGDAGFYGSTGNITLNKPIVGMASTPNGQGYWLVASDGGIFSFGNAGFYGSAGSLGLATIAGMVPTGDGGGYIIVEQDGTALSYGDAQKVYAEVVTYSNTPPSVPTNLHLAQNTTTTSVSLAWSASTDNRGVQGYKIYRNGAYIASTPNTSFTESNLQSSHSYTYQISAYDYEGGVSALSGGLTATTQNTPPTVPSNLHMTSHSVSSISIAWNAATDDVSVASYNIYRNGSIIGTTTGLTFTDNNLRKGTTYKYQVQAVDNVGAQSALSGSVSIATCKNTACK